MAALRLFASLSKPAQMLKRAALQEASSTNAAMLRCARDRTLCYYRIRPPVPAAPEQCGFRRDGRASFAINSRCSNALATVVLGTCWHHGAIKAGLQRALVLSLSGRNGAATCRAEACSGFCTLSTLRVHGFFQGQRKENRWRRRRGGQFLETAAGWIALAVTQDIEAFTEILAILRD